jgi:hypothetical protein
MIEMRLLLRIMKELMKEVHTGENAHRSRNAVVRFASLVSGAVIRENLHEVTPRVPTTPRNAPRVAIQYMSALSA